MSVQPVVRMSSLSLQSAQDIQIDVSGAENSGKERLMKLFLGTNKGMMIPLQIENEKYNVRLTSSCGQESLLGVSDARYRAAQACIFVYNIGSRESFDLFHQTKETIFRVKQTELFPFLVIGYGSPTTERCISTSEGQRAAERANCKFVEITREKKIKSSLNSFIKETISYSALLEKQKEEKENQVSEQYIGVIGDVFAGKSAFIRRLTVQKVLLPYKETKSCTTKKFKFQHEEKTQLLALIDTPGSSTAFPKELFSKVQGLIFLYSAGSKQSFEAITELREKALLAKGISEKIPSILFGTKIDLPGEMHQVGVEEGEDLAKKVGCCSFATVSLLEESCEAEIMGGIAELLQEMKKSRTSSMQGFANLDKSGLLSKTSKNLKKFSAKTYIIRDGTLYITSDGTITPKSSKLVLMEGSTVEMLPTDPAKNAFPFEVANETGKLYISAKSDVDRKSWVDAIITNIALATVSSGLLEDVAKQMLYEIITDPELHAEPVLSPVVAERKRSGTTSPFKKSKAEAEISEQTKTKSSLRNSFRSIGRRKTTTTALKSPMTPTRK